MDEAKILSRFEEIQTQLARERKARLHAWVPRSLVVLGLAIFALIWANSLNVVEKQNEDRLAVREQVCLAINENKRTVEDLIIAVRDQSPDPKAVQDFLDDFRVELKPLDCSKPFVTTTTNGNPGG